MKTPLMLGLALSLAAAAPPPAHYAPAETVVGPDGGGWDYARVDPAARRLYVARSTSVTVFDLDGKAPAHAIGQISHGHAVVPVSGGRLLVTSGDDASARFLDAGTGRELARVAVGRDPDAAILSADGKTAFVMNAEDGSVSVLDVAGMKVLRTIRVKPALEYAAIARDGTLFVNDEDANEMEVVDLRRGTTGAAVALPGCEAPSGLAYDAATGRLVAACANGKAAVVDARRRTLVGLVDIGLGPDAVLLDAKRRLAFVPCGKDGVLDILSLDGPTVRRVARVQTSVGARTGALDPASGAIYLPTASFDPPQTAGGRPVPRPGTFRVVVVRPR